MGFQKNSKTLLTSAGNDGKMHKGVDPDTPPRQPMTTQNLNSTSTTTVPTLSAD